MAMVEDWTAELPAARLVDLEVDESAELGYGSFSKVYLARHKRRAEEWYAIKMAPNADAGAAEALAREWKILEVVREVDGVVEAYDFVAEGSHSCLVLEFMSGGELFERIVERERYSEWDARNLARRLLSIVRGIHAKRVLHRDIKPENLLLSDDDDDVKLADFGSAVLLEDESTVLGEPAGTELYLAPEVLQCLYSPRAPSPAGFASDVWSVGVVVFVLIAGFPPFANQDGQVDEAVVDDIQHGRLDFGDEVWDDVSTEAKSLVAALIQVSPEKRLSATAALHHQWFHEDTQISDHNLARTISNIQDRLKPRQKLKRGIQAVVAATRAKRLSESKSSSL